MVRAVKPPPKRLLLSVLLRHKASPHFALAELAHALCPILSRLRHANRAQSLVGPRAKTPAPRSNFSPHVPPLRPASFAGQGCPDRAAPPAPSRKGRLPRVPLPRKAPPLCCTARSLLLRDSAVAAKTHNA